MHTLSLPVVATFALAAAFGIAGAVQLAGVGVVRQAYDRWGYPSTVFRLTGALELLAAILIANSSARLIGLALAAAVNFIAVVLLLKNREYGMAMPGVVVAAALPMTLILIRTY